MNKIVKKKLFRIEFDLASALAIGSGENQSTDKDIIIGSDNNPYIPASAIAGVCINALDMANSPEERKYKDYWGYITKSDGTQNEDDIKSVESRLIFYDAYMKDDQKAVVSVRDSVALDEFKTAISGAKFDMEVVEPGIRFVTYIEQAFYSYEDDELGRAIAERFISEDIYFGSKTSRGYGSINNVEVHTFEVNFKKPSDNADGDASEKWKQSLQEWAGCTIDDLPWKPFPFEEEPPVKLMSKSRNERKIIISLKQVGGISIQKYTTEVAQSEGDTAPDFTQLTTSCGIDENGKQVIKPVIPGTSWAGAFEHQMKKILGSAFDQDEWNKVFGYVKQSGKKAENKDDQAESCKNTKEKNKQKSKIRFEESIINDAIEKQLSRNAIDRFSGGTKNGALFTERTYYGGKTELIIGINEDANMSEKLAKALAASILDLHYGFMDVGGETSIGRGLFEVSGIKGVDKIPDANSVDGSKEFYQSVYNLLINEKDGREQC